MGRLREIGDLYLVPQFPPPRLGPASYRKCLLGAVRKAARRFPSPSRKWVSDGVSSANSTLSLVFVTDAKGDEQLVLQESNRNVLPGVPLSVGRPAMLTASRVRVEVEGYYKPMQSLLFGGGEINDSPAKLGR